MDRAEKRRKFGEGPWLDEPDSQEWEAHGYPCAIVRAPIGTLSGYIDLPEGHPWFGAPDDADVHGGITYSERRGERWRIGFDTAHCGDQIPQVMHLCSDEYRDSIMAREPYRDIRYVKHETERLAEQAKRAAE